MKQKRKEQPINLKRYWIGFSLLAILLLIPFRIMNRSDVQNTIYTAISIFACIAIFRFVSRYDWRQKIVIAMFACFVLPLVQIMTIQTETHKLQWTACETQVNGLLEQQTCENPPCDGGYKFQYIGFRDIPIKILIFHGTNFEYPYTGRW